MLDAGPDRAALVRAVVAAGVDRVQLRDRTLGGRALLETARAFHAAMREGAGERASACALIVNRRLDVAVALAAEAGPTLPVGVHLGFDALPLERAREALRELGAAGGPLGVAAHAPGEVAAAAAAGADYAHLAPIFDPFSKPATRPALGTSALREASKGLGGCRLVAQGGIDAARAAEAVAAGADGVAVTGAILSASGPEEAAEAAARLRATLDGAARARADAPLSPGAPPAEDEP